MCFSVVDYCGVVFYLWDSYVAYLGEAVYLLSYWLVSQIPMRITMVQWLISGTYTILYIYIYTILQYIYYSNIIFDSNFAINEILHSFLLICLFFSPPLLIINVLCLTLSIALKY